MPHGLWGKADQRKAPGFAGRIFVGARGRCHEVPRPLVPVALLLDLDDEHSLVNGAVFGLALQWLLDRESFPFEAAARQTEDRLMAYLTTAPPDGVRPAELVGRCLDALKSLCPASSCW